MLDDNIYETLRDAHDRANALADEAWLVFQACHNIEHIDSVPVPEFDNLTTYEYAYRLYARANQNYRNALFEFYKYIKNNDQQP